MAIPKFVLAVPFIVLGATLPSWTSGQSLPKRSNLVGMEQVRFDRDVVTIHEGQTIEFINNSNFLHVIGPGDRARVSDGVGVPAFGPDRVRSMPRGSPFVTEAWETRGSFRLTCTLHPEMNLEVVVEK